jgi:diguanylate cyclase (GGDEF)-like protein
MSNGADSAFPHAGPTRILLVGDIRKAFVDADCAGRYPCEVAANPLDAIEIAADGHFGVVAVVMEGLAGRLDAVLKALRKGTDARIVLLTQMFEEPIARRLTTQEWDAHKLADDYLLCPTWLKRLCDREGKLGVEPASTVSLRSGPGVRSVDWTGVDVGRLEQRMRLLERLAMTDDLTGLRNRRYTLEFARQILERAKQDNGRVTLLLFDIDCFKHYNDTYGHLAGDEILKQAGVLMRRCCRPHDVVGRVGGDEFAVIFWDEPYRTDDHSMEDRRSAATDHPSEAISVAKRFQKEFGDADLSLLGPLGSGLLTISGGLASFPRDGSSVEELFCRADQALLDAKRNGKNRICLVGASHSDIADFI